MSFSLFICCEWPEVPKLLHVTQYDSVWLEGGITISDEVPLLKGILSALQNVKGKYALMWKWNSHVHTCWSWHFSGTRWPVNPKYNLLPLPGSNHIRVIFGSRSFYQNSSDVCHLYIFPSLNKNQETFIFFEGRGRQTYTHPPGTVFFLFSITLDVDLENENSDCSIHCCPSRFSFFLVVDKDDNRVIAVPAE